MLRQFAGLLQYDSLPALVIILAMKIVQLTYVCPALGTTDVDRHDPCSRSLCSCNSTTRFGQC